MCEAGSDNRLRAYSPPIRKHPLGSGEAGSPSGRGRQQSLTASVTEQNSDVVTFESRENPPQLGLEHNFSSQNNREGPAGSAHTTPLATCHRLPGGVGKTHEERKRRSEFRESIQNLLRKSPMKFKELYPAIAERHPERCTVQGGKVNPSSMAWLIEIQCDLDEIAVNRDGVWHLKQTASGRYDRQDLYDKVWAQPMQRIAKEYGVSDVALARACKRRSVPVPGVGYWAKKAAGKPVPEQPPLPPELTNDSKRAVSPNHSGVKSLFSSQLSVPHGGHSRVT